MQPETLGLYTFRPLKEGDEHAEAAARAFARASVFERVWLHGALELDILRAAAEPLVAFHGERLAGLAVRIAGLFPFRAVAIDACLPGVATGLFARLEPPFVCRVPARLTPEIVRAGGRLIRVEREMARLDPSDSRPVLEREIERLGDAAEIARFCGPSFAPLALELGPFFGTRDAFGDLTAVAGTRFVTERVALAGPLATREDCRRQGLARVLAGAWAAALETPERRVLALVDAGERPAERLFARLGFRGVHDFAVFAR